ncbi:SAM-dependent methyltransferase [Bacillus coahuilensis p1.1.43]|uniref:SAM-dependent methyltransferase n=1 Tax=Bacillus coahuilensis p1.1.43 TaxID=1150625 RepID=A0A147KBK5_9BACI|nr:class I SAM-dependent methyltransferase [Bacillus coahuilensis]KUP08484.1 SAM-dependent methyltransferase [Bacillus coahuilensis p1.1.43]
MNEHARDEELNINTTGDPNAFTHSFHYHRYEPTPYIGLDELFGVLTLSYDERLVDFGCGKGRMNFYVHSYGKGKAIGVEYEEEFYRNSLVNLENYRKKYDVVHDEITFYHGLAETYPIQTQDTIFYFFNPFTVAIFRRVVKNILHSYASSPRDISLVLYYPSEDYLFFLENETKFVLKREVRIPGLFEHNRNERFLLYTIVKNL